MNKTLLFILLIISQRLFCQCPFTVKLDSTGNCTGSTLTVNTGSTISSIVWYNGNTPVQTVLPTPAASGITVAGGNGPGAGASQLNFPRGIYMDALGNLYISDNVNHRVQQWAPGAASGNTVAGGNGMGAAANQLNGPEGVFADAAGNVYVADYGNLRIQKWAPGATSGVTVAGGNGSGPAANQFNFPVGFFVDGAGNIYVADNNNHRIQKWAPGATNGVTVAGGNGAGSAANQLDNPMDVFVDAAGNIYIADLMNYRIQKWAPGATSGVTVAGGHGRGNADNQLAGVYSLFVDAAGNVYVCDADNNRVQKWPSGAASGITVAGGNGAGSAANQLNDPRDFFVASNGDIYIADEQNARVQKWVQSTINSSYITTAPGTYTAVVTDANGCTVTTNAVEIKNAQVPSVSITASATSITNCGTISFTAVPVNGGISPVYQWQVNSSNRGSNSASFNYNNWQTGDVVTCILTSSSTCAIPANAASNPVIITVTSPSVVNIRSKGSTCLGDTLYISNGDSLSHITWYQGTEIVKTAAALDGTMGVTVAGGNGQGTGDNQLTNPMGIFVDAFGNLFITDTYNNRIQKWAPGAVTGVTVAGISSIFGSNNPEQLDHPTDVYVDANGDIYISDPAVPNSRVQKWSVGATSGIRVAGYNGPGPGPEQFNGPFGLWMDPDKNLYVVDQSNNRVQKWVPGATVGITVAGGNGPGDAANQFNGPTDLYMDIHGNLYIVDLMNARVQKWAPGATSGVTVAGGNGTGSAANQLTNPIGVYVDQQGNVYVTDPINNRVQKWPPGATSGITVAGGNGQGNAANQLSYPTSVFVDGEGNIYVSDMGNNRVQKFTPGSTIDTTYLPASPGSYTAIVTNSNGCIVTTPAFVINATSHPAISITASDTSTCSGSIVNFTATVADGGSNPVYQWQVNGVNVGTNKATFSTNSVGNGAIVRCILTSNAPCPSNAKDTSAVIVMEVIGNTAPAVNITASQTNICPGGAITFTAIASNAGSTPVYQWKVNGNNAGTSNAVFTTTTLLNADVVSCVITSSLSCSSVTTAVSNNITINVSADAAVATVVASDNDICPGDPVNFTVSVQPVQQGLSYQWQVNDVNVGTNSTVYTANTFTDGDVVKCIVNNNTACGTAVSNSIVLTVNPTPAVNPQVVATQKGQPVVLNPSVTGVVASYLWSPATYLSDTGIEQPVSTPVEDITYHLQVVSIDGCKGSGDITVKVMSRVAVPSAFTPNGDGKNDIFYVLGYEPGSVITSFSVFNRWGQLIFQRGNIVSGDASAGWDGKYKGTLASPGAYVYLINITLGNGAKKVFKGTVELIR